MKKVLSSFLIFMLLFEMLTPIFATEIITDGGNNEVPVELTQAITSFSVTVPTVLPVDLDANGVVTVATDNKIINNSWGPVEVKGVSLTPLNDWGLVDFETNFNEKKVGIKEFGFQMNGTNVEIDGSCLAEFEVIPGNSYINFTYDANVATQRQALEDIQIAFVIFTIGWANSNSNSFIPVTSIDGNGNNLNATSTNIVGNQKEELLASLDASGLANSADVDYLINVESDDFYGMADTTFDLTGIANSGDTVVILHYDETAESWEYVATEIVDANGMVNADFSSYSPVVFIINGETIIESPASYFRIYEAGVIAGLTDEGKAAVNSGERIVIPKVINGVLTTEIGYGAFSDTTLNLTSIIIPNSITTIDARAFAGASITSIIIPDSVTYIGESAFRHCPMLTDVIIGNGVISIEEATFADCPNLVNVTIGNGVTIIGFKAFEDCISLSNVIISNSVTDILNQVFNCCTSLTNITIPDSVVNIGECVFQSCVNLNSVTLGSGIRSIGSQAFYICDSLDTVYYMGTEEQWRQIYIASWNDDLHNAIKVFNYNPDSPYLSTFVDNSWEDIIAACENNEVPDSWQVGDTKPMTIDGVDYNIQIIGKHHDVYSDGSGTAPLTFQLSESYGTQYQMNETNDNTTGWSASKMRTITLLDIFNQLPSEVQSAIKLVDKETLSGNKNGLEVTSDKLFLLSETEVLGTTVQSNGYVEGSRYEFYSDGGSVTKNFEGSTYYWWLRTPLYLYSNHFSTIDLEGNVNNGSANYFAGVAFGFCF